jgi:hypothetical protein
VISRVPLPFVDAGCRVIYYNREVTATTRQEQQLAMDI